MNLHTSKLDGGTGITQRHIETDRHRTVWIEAGPAEGPLMIFVHGWPELGLVWRQQIEYFSALGWRCVAPDMRGYGGSSRPDTMAAYTDRELVADMIELHDALGGAPAVWVGHDLGSGVVWNMASHHPSRCRGVVSLCVPYLARGFALPNLLPLVDRDVYPEERYPVGQWDYRLFYRECFAQSSKEFEADVAATLALFFQTASPHQLGQPAFTADVRAQKGWFGPAGRAPAMPLSNVLLDKEDFDTIVEAFTATGFAGADSWYMNDTANIAYAAESLNFGRLTLPVCFIHASYDTVCETLQSRLAEPMREDCEQLSEVTIEGGHEIMLEAPTAVNEAILNWLRSTAIA